MHLVSDFCNRVNQSSGFKLKKTVVKNSKLVSNSSFLMYKLGYILFFIIKNFKFIIIYLKYLMFGPAIRGLFSLSKPSLKYYLKYKNIVKFSFNNFFGLIGFMALSTNKKKILLDFECVSNSIGGKPLWVIY